MRARGLFLFTKSPVLAKIGVYFWKMKKPLSDPDHQELYTSAIKHAREVGDDAFQGWFNKSGSVYESEVRGYWDFSFHILTDKVCKYLSSAHTKTALEIGYGGGRLLNAACSFFGKVIGVDIHNERETVEKFLRKNGKNNFTLLQTSGSEIAVPSESVNFVYSFIVLQHLPRFEVLENYVKETFRVLVPGGVAQLYIGRMPGYNPRRLASLFLKGYVEMPDTVVNSRSLAVQRWKMKSLCRKYGFRVVDSGPSYKGVPDGYPLAKGGQWYVTLVKPK